MKYIFSVFAVLMVIVRSCYLIYDPYCCDGNQYVNDCFAKTAGEDLERCVNCECPVPGGIECVLTNSSEWKSAQEYVTMLDSKINAKLLDAGVKFNYGCWDHQRLKGVKMQVVNGNNYWVKLELLCDPLDNYAHVYFYVPTYWAYNFTQTLLNEKQRDNIKDDINVIIQNATKLSDYIRYAMFDKYFKQIPCYNVDCPAGQWQAAYNSSTYLLNWYMAWGGAIPGQFGTWSWRIGASHAHQGYQNVMTAHVISEVDAFKSKTQNGVTQWSKVKQTTLDLWQWLQSAEGPLAGGVTNSVGGRYLDPASRNITGFFKGLSYQWEPVYDDPPSNNWFGMNAWSQERNAEYYYLTGDKQAGAILDKWYKWIESLSDKIILDNNDFAIPSNLHWEGQPTTWDGNGEIPIQNNLHGTVIDYSKDVGVGSALAHTLTFYAAATGNSNAQTMARELLDRMYLYADNIGIGINETRQDYIGNEYGNGFWEPVYVPQGYKGWYPNGDVIQPGINFTDIRSWYKSDPWWPYIQECKNKNIAPSLIYHRLWAQVEYALACGDYARLFGSSSKYYVGFDNDKYF